MHIDMLEKTIKLAKTDIKKAEEVAKKHLQ